MAGLRLIVREYEDLRSVIDWSMISEQSYSPGCLNYSRGVGNPIPKPEQYLSTALIEKLRIKSTKL